MSFADNVFTRTCREILAYGTSDEAFQVRPKWLDGTPAHTKMLINVCQHYNLAVDSIPVMTLRKTGFRNAIDEILWIYQRHSSDLTDLHSHIWDAWDVGDGTIGKAYGYQIAKLSRHHKVKGDEDLSMYPSAGITDGWVYLNQIDAVLYDLQHNCASRSILTNTYNHEDLTEMGLRPCAYSMTFMVTEQDGVRYLNGLLNQRSQDMLTANNWNVVQYSVLLQMIAQVCGMKPGKFTHMVANAHIYDRHIPIVEKMIQRYTEAALEYRVTHPTTYSVSHACNVMRQYEDEMNSVPHPNPKFWINPEVKSFYDFTVDDFKLIDYEYDQFNEKFEVAV